ncbi:MAG TPA: hypothetical protein VK506_07820 [Conexibacter sp.]|nr:hypothetical protein [Conexibacter sp.]
MIKQIKLLLLTAAIALVAITAIASSASALTARVAPGGNITADSNGRLTFGSGSTEIQCDVSLKGDVLTSAGIDAGDQIGSIDIVEINVGTCSGGTVVDVLNLEWRLTVRALLPNAAAAPNNLTGFSIDILDAAFELEGFGGVDCLYRGNAAGLQRTIDTGVNTYRTEDQRALEEVTLPRVNERSDPFGCPATGSFRGTFDMTPVQSITVS